MKTYSFTPPLIGYTVVGLMVFVAFVVLLALTNKVLGTETVLETYAGTKSVCTGYEYNYSLKHTVCKAHATVPATCKKTRLDGPIFDPIIYDECN